jgi:hypothetical protein
LHGLLLAKKNCTPEVSEQDVLELYADLELAEQFLPVLGLHCVVAEIHQHLIELLVVLQVISVNLVDLVRPHPGRELSHLV